MCQTWFKWGQSRPEVRDIQYNENEKLSTGPTGKLSANHAPPMEMNLAPGGLITQAIVKDRWENDSLNEDDSTWDASRTKVFNVQIFNTSYFQQVTGARPPETPIDAKTSEKLGLPFFVMDEEPTDVSGDFNGVKSIAQRDGISEPVVKPSRIIRIGQVLLFRRPSTSSASGISTAESGSGYSTADSTKSFFRSLRGKKGGKGARVSQPTPANSTPTATGTPVKSWGSSPRNSVIDESFFNPKGPLSKFRPLSVMERDWKGKERVSFT
jgi:hypothetical protein